MDIKPGNIFISRDKRLHAVNDDLADDGFEEDDPVPIEEEITYKIGNWEGVITCVLILCVFETSVIFHHHYNIIIICKIMKFCCLVAWSRPPLWSSDQCSWLLTQRSGFDCRRYQIF
jgi:hypothetical protein